MEEVLNREGTIISFGDWVLLPISNPKKRARDENGNWGQAKDRPIIPGNSLGLLKTNNRNQWTHDVEAGKKLSRGNRKRHSTITGRNEIGDSGEGRRRRSKPL